MRLRLGARGLLTAALALGTLPLGAGLAAVPVASGAATPKVMIMGDSVAHQFDGDYTWRYRVWGEFKRQKKPVDFVGPFRWGYGDAHTYLGQKGWDSDHDAQGATLITDFMDIDPVPGAPNWGRYDIVPTLQTYKPDVLVSVMGNNDVNNLLSGFNYGFPSIHDLIKQQGQTASTEAKVDQVIADVLDDYQAFLVSVRSVKPDEKIVIAQITNQLIEPWVRDRVNAAFADQLTSTATSPVVVAHTDDPKWAQAGYTVDGIHTTPTGDLLMGQRIAEGIHAIAPTVLGVPKIPQITIAWNPVLKPSIKVASSKITVNWGVAARANTVLGIRLKFVNMTTKKATYATYSQTSSWTSAVQKPGVYRVRLQGIRGNMTSTWSPVFVVTVPKPRK